MAKTTSKKSASKGSSSSGRGASSNSASKGASRSSSSTASKSSGGSRGGGAAKSAPKKAAAKSAPKKAARAKKVAVKSASSNRSSASRSGSNGRAAAGFNDQGLLQELFHDSLKDIYWAEKHLLKALPKMRKAATSSELQQAFETHTQQTQTQVGRLEQVFEALGKKAQGKKCEAMDGLTKEAEEIISSTQKGSMTRDVGLIMAAQKVEHYEIATYGSLATLAATVGNQQVKELLGQTLQEEKETDELLTQIAESNVNQQAAQNESSESSSGSSSQGGDEEDENEG
jgi:ferritin-like metal-binding protein YciE